MLKKINIKLDLKNLDTKLNNLHINDEFSINHYNLFGSNRRKV